MDQAVNTDAIVLRFANAQVLVITSATLVVVADDSLIATHEDKAVLEQVLQHTGKINDQPWRTSQ